MPHARQQIREAVAAALAANATTAGRVYQSRVWPVAEDRLPCLLVFTRREQSARDAQASSTSSWAQARAVELVIEGIVAAAEATMDDTLDTIAGEVETALAAAGDLGGQVKDIELGSTALEQRARDGERAVGAVQLVYAVSYRTREGVPDTIID